MAGLLREEEGLGKERDLLTKGSRRGSHYPYTPPGQRKKESLRREVTSREVEIDTVSPYQRELSGRSEELERGALSGPNTDQAKYIHSILTF